MNNNIPTSASSGPWKGLSLDEIRYQRALTEIRIEISKEKLKTSAQGLTPNSIKGFKFKSKSILSKMLGALSWIDYGVMAITIGSKLRKILNRNKLS